MDKDLQAMRHSLAHVLAYSVKQLYPGSHNAIGPAIEDGFYQDFAMSQPVTEADLPKIEAKMREVLGEWKGFKRREVSLDEALDIFADNPYKQELAHEFAEGGKTLTVYTSGDFDDLCKGGHTENTSDINPDAFKLTKTAGAYWRGDESKAMLSRIYGAAFNTKQELDQYLATVEEAKARDHRVLGQELDLFTSSELVGSGLPLFTPKGTVLRELLGRYSQQLREARGFERVWTPHMTKTELYKTSGHWDKFGDELFLVKSQETSDELVLKPMNCPHHAQIFARTQHSYRDLPIRYMENTTDYRDEKSGELHGLSRVRSLTQDDSHVFCREDQIEQEVASLVQAAGEMYQELELDLKFRLSYRDDSDAYLGDAKLWQRAQDTLKKVAEDNKLDYYEEEGEAAFYGPKIDFIAIDALGREWQVATVQLDFVQPERFGLKYTDAEGKEHMPVMLHCALLGTIERFLSVYIEHTAGRFPFWLAPEQVRILSVNDEVQDYIGQIVETLKTVVLMKPLRHNELRYSVDERNESLGKKISEAERDKVPLIMIVGPKDRDSTEVSVRVDGKEDKIKLDGLEEYVLGL